MFDANFFKEHGHKYKKIQTLGKGAFGEVVLAKRLTGELLKIFLY